MGSEWLLDALKGCTLTSEVEDYLLGRGVKDSTIAAEGMKTWHPLPEPAPDPEFRKLFWPHGERLDGMMVCPIWSPKGSLIGFEARNIHQKKILDYRLPCAKWTPFFIGTRKAMPAIWAGGDIWIGEGLFDLAALEWAIPPRDAVLASVRAHLDRQQLDFLRRFCRGAVHMVYDLDETGRKATVGWNDPDTGKRRPGALELLERVVEAVPMPCSLHPRAAKDGSKDCLHCVRCGSSVAARDLRKCPRCMWSGLTCQDVKYMGGKDPGEIWDKGGQSGVRAAFRL